MWLIATSNNLPDCIVGVQIDKLVKRFLFHVGQNVERPSTLIIIPIAALIACV